MKKYEKEVLEARLDSEEDVMKKLKSIYEAAAKDVANKIEISNGKINVLLADWDNLSDDDKSVYQAQIYHRNFQQSLKRQIDGFLKDLNSNQYGSIEEYLENCYNDGFIGAMYSINQQGIPLIVPIDQKKVVKAMFTDSQINEELYTSLGEDVVQLKKKIASTVSRGIATADAYSNIARNIANDSKVGFNRAMRIARTEGARISNQSALDASYEAKKAGANVVKQWCSTLDGNTRPHHRQLDGQIRELDEPFEIAGKEAMHPVGFGRPEEDINCRCSILQRATWALGEEELEELRLRAKFHGNRVEDSKTFGHEKAKDFAHFKKNYLYQAEEIRKELENIRTTNISQRRKKLNESVFSTFNNTKADAMKPKNIMNEMKKSAVGSSALEYLQKENVSVKLCYGVDNPKKYLGIYDPFDDEITIYCDETKTIQETALTAIHEATHRRLGGAGTFEEEVECYKQEALHTKEMLTNEDIENIILFVKETYPDLVD